MPDIRRRVRIHRRTNASRLQATIDANIGVVEYDEPENTGDIELVDDDFIHEDGLTEKQVECLNDGGTYFPAP